jgi:hypothetical protein
MIRLIPRILMALWCFLLLSAACAVAQTPERVPDKQRDGTFKTVQGDVTVVRHNARVAAIVGGPIRSADRIQTGANGAAAVTLNDGTIISIGPNSVVNLSAFQFNVTTNEGILLVDLLRGTLRMVSGMIAKISPDAVKVTTPTSVIGVRGTDFVVEANP